VVASPLFLEEESAREGESQREGRIIKMEDNVQSSLAGVQIRFWDNEKNCLLIWQSIPSDEDKDYVVEETKTRLKLGKKKKKS